MPTALKSCFAGTFGGTLIFMCLVAVSILTPRFNADNWPAVPWFPVPVLAAVFLGVACWCDNRWDISLRAGFFFAWQPGCCNCSERPLTTQSGRSPSVCSARRWGYYSVPPD
jgi:hypothetical protein